MNDEQLKDYHRKGFMDKCASAGLTTEEAEELYKQAFWLPLAKGAWRLGSGIFKGGIKGRAARKVAGRKGMAGAGWLGKNVVLPMGLWEGYDYMLGGGNTPEQPQQPAGVPGYQPPQRQYGSSKLNVKGLGGITPYLN